mgnify:CR=1 FL=1
MISGLDRISKEDGGDLYLINGNMTKLADAGIFAASAPSQETEEPDETQEDDTHEEPEEPDARLHERRNTPL